jgi:hypothetical protein
MIDNMVIEESAFFSSIVFDDEFLQVSYKVFFIKIFDTLFNKRCHYVEVILHASLF